MEGNGWVFYFPGLPVGEPTPVNTLSHGFLGCVSEFRCYLSLSVGVLEQLFVDDPDKLSVGMKDGMVEELVKMLYFDYEIDVEVCR